MTVNIFQTGTETLLEKVELEIKGKGRPDADVMWIQEKAAMERLADRGLLARYLPAGHEAIDERYKDDEPAPTRRQPGFKEPRRIQVQYFSYKPAGAFARKLASKATELLPLFRLGGPAATFAAGGAPGSNPTPGT